MKWQTEAMYRRFEAGRGADQSFPVAETFHDWGMYSQVVWGFKKGWTAGVRGDYLHMQDSAFTGRRPTTKPLAGFGRTDLVSDRVFQNPAAVQPRLSTGGRFLRQREADSAFLQFEFILGAHGAHKF